tara:strand:- start:17494 stop:17775 length:282 start_codon:yes stop_codon:yes gene_type:complete
MSLTSTKFEEVWPSFPTPSIVSARVVNDVDERKELPPHIHILVDGLNREMMQRTNMFAVVLIVITVLLLQRIGRLERRLMIQTIGASLPNNWW